MIYQRIRNICKENGTTITAMGKALGISAGSIDGWKHGAFPRSDTIQKIADYFGVTTDYLLGDPGAESAAQDLQPKSSGVKIPVFGNVAAGIPIEAITDIEDYEEITQDMASKGEYFGLRIRGNSMEPRICNGDVIIIRRQEDADTGDIAVVMINGSDATCKKIKKTPEGVELIPLNNAYKPMFFTNQQVQDFPVRVIGKVVELRAKFK